MMKAKPVIEVKDIHKSYMISHRLLRNAHPTIKDDFSRMIRKPLELMGAAGGVTKEELKALDGVSFNVEKGEVVGLVGRNGSGKSTMFKILSRITQPSKGEAILRGRTGSLLEVGTGFHPELTGRENVYLNGSILGMKKREIDEKFDDIVEFSEIENFLDTPVKFYSSGMKVRLGFSVASFLDPEILLIDEVLAVGDMRFKQKCFAKMDEIASAGRTIMFVSHSMAHVKRICTRAILLQDGKIAMSGNVDEIAAAYLDAKPGEASIDEDAEVLDKHNSVDGKLLSVRARRIKSYMNGGLPRVEVDILVENTTTKDLSFHAEIDIRDSYTNKLATISTSVKGEPLSISKKSSRMIYFVIDDVNLLPGDYGITTRVVDGALTGMTYGTKDESTKLSVGEYSFFDATNIEKALNGIGPVLYDFNYSHEPK